MGWCPNCKHRSTRCVRIPVGTTDAEKSLFLSATRIEEWLAGRHADQRVAPVADTDFGHADCGQNWCFSLLAFFFFFKKKKEQQDEKMHRRTNTLRAPKGGPPKGCRPYTQKNGAPKGGVLMGEAWKGGWPIISRFFPSPATILLFLCLSGCLLVEFWWCLKRREPETCTEQYAPGKDFDDWDFTCNGYAGYARSCPSCFGVKTAKQSPTVVDGDTTTRTAVLQPC